MLQEVSYPRLSSQDRLNKSLNVRNSKNAHLLSNPAGIFTHMFGELLIMLTRFRIQKEGQSQSFGRPYHGRIRWHKLLSSFLQCIKNHVRDYQTRKFCHHHCRRRRRHHHHHHHHHPCHLLLHLARVDMELFIS